MTSRRPQLRGLREQATVPLLSPDPTPETPLAPPSEALQAGCCGEEIARRERPRRCREPVAPGKPWCWEDWQRHQPDERRGKTVLVLGRQRLGTGAEA